MADETETILGLKKKLSLIQSDIKVAKSQFNSYGGYAYRSADDIYNGVKPYLTAYGCALVISDCLEQVGDNVYLRADVSLCDCDSDDIITVHGYARESIHGNMSGDQMTGTASSYARKNALTALFLLASDEQSYNGKGQTAAKTAESKTDTINIDKCEICGKKIYIPKGWTKKKLAAWYVKENGGKVECKDCMNKKIEK